MLGFPAVTLRDSIERPEALDTGGIVMTGLDARDVVDAVRVAMASPRAAVTPLDYTVTNTSVRAVNFILSTARRHAAWAGIRVSKQPPATDRTDDPSLATEYQDGHGQ